jgi:hypothetical protein
MGATLIMYKTSKKSTITQTKVDLNTMTQSKVVTDVPANTLIMQITYTDGSTSKEILSQSESYGKKRYDYPNDHGEYFQLETNGNLGLCGKNGKFDEAIIIK